MRVIYQTSPVEATFTDQRTTRTLSGSASFRVYMFEPNEELPALPTVAATRGQCRLLSELRAEAGHGQPIMARMNPRSPLRGILPDVITIPEVVLESLPGDALLRFAWGFGSGEGPDLQPGGRPSR